MLTISSKEDYALVLMIALAKKKTSSPVSLRLISKKHNLPFRYLCQIAGNLKKAGVLDSKEGIGGGYFLTKAPSKITLEEIFLAVSGPWAPTRCLQSGEICPAQKNCPLKSVWRGMENDYFDSIAKKTLASLIREEVRGK
jgi:Rrf2 family protein